MSTLNSVSEDAIKGMKRAELLALAENSGIDVRNADDIKTSSLRELLLEKKKSAVPPKVYLTNAEIDKLDFDILVTIAKKYGMEIDEEEMTPNELKTLLKKRGNVSPVSRERPASPPRPAPAPVSRPVPAPAPRPASEPRAILVPETDCEDVLKSKNSCVLASKEEIIKCAEEKKGIIFTDDAKRSKDKMCTLLHPPQEKKHILELIDTRGMESWQVRRIVYLDQYTLPQLLKIIKGVRKSDTEPIQRAYPTDVPLKKDSKYQLIKQMVTWEKQHLAKNSENVLPALKVFEETYSEGRKKPITPWKVVKNNENIQVMSAEDEIDVAERTSEPAPAPRRVELPKPVVAPVVASVVSKPVAPVPAIAMAPKPVAPVPAPYAPNRTKRNDGQFEDLTNCGKTGRSVGKITRPFLEQIKKGVPLSEVFNSFATDIFKYPKGSVSLPSYLADKPEEAVRYLCEIHEDKKCDDDEDCADGKSCDVDVNKCVSVAPSVPDVNKRIINGRLFVGSKKALDAIEARMPKPKSPVRVDTTLSPEREEDSQRLPTPKADSRQKCGSVSDRPCPPDEACDAMARICKHTSVEPQIIDGIKVFGSQAAIDALRNERMAERAKGASSPEREVAPYSRPQEGQIVRVPVVQQINIPDNVVKDVRDRILKCLKIV